MAPANDSNGRRQAEAWLDLLTGESRAGSVHEMELLTGSMHPLLPVGGTLLVRAASWRESRNGDIVVLRRDQSLVAHRRLAGLTRGGRKLILEKGDANAAASWVDAKQVVGIAIGYRHADGSQIDLTTSQRRAEAVRLARRNLVAHWRHRLLKVPRRIKAWLVTATRSTDSGSEK